MEADEEARFQVYKTAFELYKGELLPAISTEIWVTTESLQFKNMFEKMYGMAGRISETSKGLQYHVSDIFQGRRDLPF